MLSFLLTHPDSLCRGAIVLKCEYRPTKVSKTRWVHLALHQGEGFLGWCKAATPKPKKTELKAIGPTALKSRVRVEQITQVIFGVQSKNFVSQNLNLHQQSDRNKHVIEWCCFSVVTQDRTYDFICQNHDEMKAFHFVIAMRHLHSHAAPHRLR